MTRSRPVRSTDRGVSTAVTHVLALGITAILISGLLLASAGLLTDQRQNAANRQLETIGNRLASQVMEADQIVDYDGNGVADRVVLRVQQPGRVAGQTYTVEYSTGVCDSFRSQQPSSGSSSTNACLTLLHDEVDGGEYEVPLELDSEVGSNVTITFQQRGSGDFLIIAEENDP